MSGFFGFMNFEKAGPGISKNAPKKKTIVVFFEAFFRNFWKFLSINLVYNLISIPVITNGLAASGITNVARNIALDKHSFGLSDFFDTIKKNFKQALGAGIINFIIYIILAIDLYFFYNLKNNTTSQIGLGLTLSILFMFTVMNYYIWTLMITFKFNLKQIYSNSFKFVFINMGKNLICLFSHILVYALYIGAAFLFSEYLALVIVLEVLLYVFTFPAFKYLMIQYCVFPSIKKHIIDPYYEEHPEDDIEKRRDLGVYVEEETSEDEDVVTDEE